MGRQVEAQIPAETSSHRSRLRVCLWVYAALLVLLALTVGSVYLDLGHWAVALNFAIATAKAMLIGLIYMSLSRDTALTRVFAVIGITWLLILFSLILADYLHR